MLENLPADILLLHDRSPKIQPLAHWTGQEAYSLLPGKQVREASHQPQWGLAVQKSQSLIYKHSS